MGMKTIKIGEENYKWLLNLAAELQKERGEKISFDVAINEIKDVKKRDIMELAGSWDMSDEESEELIERIYKERKLSTMRLKNGVS